MQKYTLKEIRTSLLNLSQEKMGHELGVTGECWRQKENYSRALKASELMKISDMAKLDPRQVILG